VPDADDQHEAHQREPERGPDPTAHVLAVDEARPQRDEQRREVLDQQCDADREPVDREEIEPLHEREACEAEDEEERQLASRQSQPPRCNGGDDGEEADRGAQRSNLREALG
jgi:hypothetical protein